MRATGALEFHRKGLADENLRRWLGLRLIKTITIFLNKKRSGVNESVKALQKL